MKKKYLVTAALPYANGSLHLGHIAGVYLPADVFTRSMRKFKQEVVSVCGTDEYGAAIALRATKENTTPQEIVDRYHQAIQDDLRHLGIHFDHFSRTTKPVHQKTALSFFFTLEKNGYLEAKEEMQYFCPANNQFLPDRYVEGECPHCGYEKARGDECPQCGKWLEVFDLKNAYSSYCIVPIEKKKTKNWMLRLDMMEEKLKNWFQSQEWNKNVDEMAKGLLQQGLRARAITRDLDWGIPLPSDFTQDERKKVLYVWFDAPIGYISATKDYFLAQGKSEEEADALWKEKDREIVHFLGKDNIVFHTIIWPAILMGQEAGYQLPTSIPAHEYLNIDTKKISTSQGKVIWVQDTKGSIPPEYLRYYLVKQAPEQKDTDFSWEHFFETIETDLMHILGNLLHRVATFVHKYFQGVVPMLSSQGRQEYQALKQEIGEKIQQIEQEYTRMHPKVALKLLLDLARQGNQLFQEKEPWRLWKENPQDPAIGDLLFMEHLLIMVLAELLYPVMPQKMQEVYSVFGGQGLLEESTLDLEALWLRDKELPIQPTQILFAPIDDEIKAEKYATQEKV